MKNLLALALMMVLLGLSGCKSDSEGEADQTSTVDRTETVVADQTEPVPVEPATDEPEIMTKPSGVRYQELVVGTGAEAVDQMQIECHYTLWLADETGTVKGEKIDSSVDRGQPFRCQLGVRLIQGWSDGMIGMKEGGKRRLLVPWALGYPDGAGARIPPQTNLIFEIEFLRAL